MLLPLHSASQPGGPFSPRLAAAKEDCSSLRKGVADMLARVKREVGRTRVETRRK